MCPSIKKIYSNRAAHLLVAAGMFSFDVFAQVRAGNAFEKDPTEKLLISTSENLHGNGLQFTPNKGQLINSKGEACPEVLYKGNAVGADIYLRKTGISYVYSNMGQVMQAVNKQVDELKMTGVISPDGEQKKKQELLQAMEMKIHRVDMDFVLSAEALAKAGNRNTEIIASDQVEGYTNYYFTHCPQGITNVHSYNEVTVKNIYTNIDVKYYGDKQNGIKYDLIVQPHADPNQIKLRWTGAESIHINREGNLVIKTSVNEFYESIPKVYQNINGKIVDIRAHYVLNGTTVNFELETWNSSFPLIIDPWATYYGGSSAYDQGSGIDTDQQGNVVITGNTQSTNFPVLGGFQMSLSAAGTNDAFVAKFNAAGVRQWASYYGGSNQDFGMDIAADIPGNISVTGYTYSTDFPVSGGSQMTIGGGYDAFAVKFNSGGIRQWATFYGGNSSDISNGIATDITGNVIITGWTLSTNFPAMNGFQMGNGGGTEAFLVKFNTAGTPLWATYCGGNGSDNANHVATDNAGNIAITGGTTSANFPVMAGFQMGFVGTGINNDAFVAKFNPGGAQLWCTFYGGSLLEEGRGITIDNAGNVIVAGNTTSVDFPVLGGAQMTFGGGGGSYGDAFVVKLNSTGSRIWATYFGGNAGEYGFKVETDIHDNIYLLMEAEDSDAPNLTDPCAYQPIFGGIEDQLIVKFKPNGQKTCATFLGGTGEDDSDSGYGDIVINGNSLYVVGTTSGGYPVTAGAFQTVYGGPVISPSSANGSLGDAFVAQLCINICESKVLGLNFTANPNSLCPNVPVTFTPSVYNSCDTSGYQFQWTFTGGNPASSTAVNPSVIFAGAGNHAVKLILTTACKKDSLTEMVVVNFPCIITATVNGAVICPNTCAALTANAANGTGPYNYIWNNGATTQTINVCPVTNTNYQVTITDAAGNTASAPAAVIIHSPIITTTTSVNIVCSNLPSSASVNVTSGALPLVYSWSNGATGSSVQNIAAGNYTVTVTDNNGCTKTDVFNITSTSAASAAFTYSPPCVGTPVNFTNTGTTGTFYEWRIKPPNPAVSGSTLNFSYTFLTAGNYEITHIVSNGGCTNTVISTINVINCNGPTVSATGSSVCSGSCATVTSSGVGGVAPYSYSWSDGSTTQNINPCPLSTTTYTVKVTDSGGTTSTATAVVNINPAVTATTTPTNITCNGTSTGSATAVPGGGTSPYIYVWSNGQTSQIISNLTAGNYTVTVVDTKGCTLTATATIVSPLPLSGQFTKGTASCAGCGCKQWIMINATGGSSPYSYTWPDGYTNRYKNELCSGNYSINIKDRNGCSINVNLTAP